MVVFCLAEHFLLKMHSKEKTRREAGFLRLICYNKILAHYKFVYNLRKLALVNNSTDNILDRRSHNRNYTHSYNHKEYNYNYSGGDGDDQKFGHPHPMLQITILS